MERQKPIDPALFEEQAVKAANLLKTMGNAHRLLILCRLGNGELSVGALREDTTLSQSALSQHLAVLRDDDLVTTRKVGQSVFYSIKDPSVLKIIETLISIYCPEMLK